MIMTLSHVALGGAIGSVLRYLATLGAARMLGAGFPYGTLLVNVVGSFIMGALFVWLSQKDALRAVPFLMTGVLGGFTTFSAFSLDAFRLWDAGQGAQAMLYVAASVGLSLSALVAGVLTLKEVLA